MGKAVPDPSNRAYWRYRFASAALSALITRGTTTPEEAAMLAADHADFLLRELEKRWEKERDRRRSSSTRTDYLG